MFETVKELLLNVGADQVLRALLQEFFAGLLAIHAESGCTDEIFQRLCTYLKAGYRAVVECADDATAAPEGLYFAGVLDLRNGNPHLLMLLQNTGDTAPSPMQYEGWHDMCYEQLAKTPVAVTPLVADNLPLALAQILFNKLACNLSQTLVTVRREQTEDEQTALKQIRDASLQYLTSAAEHERTLIDDILRNDDN